MDPHHGWTMDRRHLPSMSCGGALLWMPFLRWMHRAPSCCSCSIGGGAAPRSPIRYSGGGRHSPGAHRTSPARPRARGISDPIIHLVTLTDPIDHKQTQQQAEKPGHSWSPASPFGSFNPFCMHGHRSRALRPALLPGIDPNWPADAGKKDGVLFHSWLLGLHASAFSLFFPFFLHQRKAKAYHASSWHVSVRKKPKNTETR